MRKMLNNKKVSASLLSVLFVLNALTVEMASANVGLESKNTDETVQLKEEKQIHIKGTPEQLSLVDEKTVKFIKELALDAYQSGNKYGIFPSVILAQAILESDVGESGLTVNHNNMFGVKGSYNGNYVMLPTKEDDGNGNMFTINAAFKKYPNKQASLDDHGRLLREGLDGFYHGTWRENAKTPENATKFLEGRYATDTKYSSKLMYLINTYNLKRFDNILTERDVFWLNSNSLDPWESAIVEEYGVGQSKPQKNPLADKNVEQLIEATVLQFDNIEEYDLNYLKEILNLKETDSLKRIADDISKITYEITDELGKEPVKYAILKVNLGTDDVDSYLIKNAVQQKFNLYNSYKLMPIKMILEPKFNLK